jgi:hypoxanthine-DNA glycosylase
MSAVVAFPPIVGREPRVLVLGSLPGVASLAANEYYAHPRNAFWRIIENLTDCPASASYAERRAASIRAHIAIWDVLSAAVRPGSLDSAIDMRSIEPNDFATFFERHGAIRAICFNGGTAARLFERHVLPGLPASAHAIARVRLPSTSPAHAGRSFAAKRSAWIAALEPHLKRDAPRTPKRARR